MAALMASFVASLLQCPALEVTILVCGVRVCGGGIVGTGTEDQVIEALYQHF